MKVYRNNSKAPQVQHKANQQLNMPVNSLMKQISNLKNQLSQIKNKKSSGLFIDLSQSRQPKALSQSQSNSSLLETPTHDKTLQKFGIPQYQQQLLRGISFPIEAVEKKMNQTIKKLCRAIKKGQTQLPYKYLYRLIAIFTEIIRELQQNNLQPKTTLNKYTTKQNHADFYQNINQQLQAEVLDLKQQIAGLIDQNETKQKQLLEIDAGCKVVIDKYQKLFQQFQNSKDIYQGLRYQKQRLQQTCKIYEHQLLNKQEQILLMKQDIKYNREQSEKHRNQKKQLEKLYQNLISEHKQLKSIYEENVQNVDKQKNKWKNQCQSRRINQQEIIDLQQKTNSMRKEVNDTRKQISKTQSDYSNILKRFQEQQTKNIELQSQKYRLQIQNERLVCSVEYCKKQMKVLGQEVQKLTDDLNKYKQNYRTSEPYIKNQQKAKVLNQLHHLIKQQKQSDLSP